MNSLSTVWKNSCAFVKFALLQDDIPPQVNLQDYESTATPAAVRPYEPNANVIFLTVPMLAC